MTVNDSKIRDLVYPEAAYPCADHVDIILSKSNIAINFVDLPEDFDDYDAEYLFDNLGAKLSNRFNGEITPKEFEFLSEHTLRLTFDVAC